jgi:anti-sigma B factor antagonist
VQPVPFGVSSENHSDGVRIVTIRGELDLNTAPQLEGELERIRGSAGSVVVNLSACEFIDSTGIALLVNAWQQVDRNGSSGSGRLVLCCPNRQVRRLLDITGVESSIDVHEDVEDALTAVGSA